jgi:hypothetical protein
MLFLIPATLMAHAFWQVGGTSLYMVQLINFFKNVCMAGGLAFIAAAKDQPVLLPGSTRVGSYAHRSFGLAGCDCGKQSVEAGMSFISKVMLR